MKLINERWFPDHETQFQKWMKGSTYQKQTFDLALHHCKQKRVAIDVGAHVGLWANEMAREFKQVFAFEPDFENRRCLYANVPFDNVTVIPYPVAHQDNIPIALTPLQEGNTGSLYAVPVSGSQPALPTVALDTYALWFDVDLLKVDVEGMELLVLRGAERLLDTWKPVVVLEDKGHGSRYGVVKGECGIFLQQLGYRMVQQVGNDYIYAV